MTRWAEYKLVETARKSLLGPPLDVTKAALDCCQAVGAETLVGPYHSAFGAFSGTGPTADKWKWGVDGTRAVAEHAETAGVNLAFESLNRFETYLLNCVSSLPA